MYYIIFLFLALATESLSAQEIKTFGQIRERSELDNRSFQSGTSVDAYHLLRSRIGITAAIGEHYSATIELQDARLFGETRSTFNTGATAFDLRQGFIEMEDSGTVSVGLRLGRQVLGYGNERILGGVDWSNLGQSFDGAVARLAVGDVHIDLIGAAIARNGNNPRYNRDVFLAGSWCGWRPLGSSTTVQGYYLFDNPHTDTLRQNRHTAGMYAKGEISGFDYELDGAYQFGDYIVGGESPQDRSISASLVGVRGGYTLKQLKRLRVGLGYDRLSGHNPDAPEEYGVFNTLYATNHKFYGAMDYFLNIPVSTGGMGLQHLLAQVSVYPVEWLGLAADLHLFTLLSQPDRINPTLPVGSSRAIGKELDLTATYKGSDAVSIQAGYSVFDGDGDRVILRGRKTTGWGFVSTTVRF